MSPQDVLTLVLILATAVAIVKHIVDIVDTIRSWEDED